MLPYIDILNYHISTYAVMASIGFFVMCLVAWLVTRRQSDIDTTQIVHIALAAMAGLFVGAHVLYGAVNIRILVNAVKDHFSLLHSPMDYLNLFIVIFGGMVFYGGLFGAIIGAVWYMKALKLPLLPYFDVMAFCIPLFHGFARIGCFLGGCCYGIESRYGLVYHDAIEPSANGVPRFPVQLLESGMEFLLFGVILALYMRKKLKGKLMYIYLLSYAVVRFLDEFLRGDRIRGFVGPLSTSQFISLLVFVTVVIILAFGRRKTGESHSPARQEACENWET